MSAKAAGKRPAALQEEKGPEEPRGVRRRGAMDEAMAGAAGEGGGAAASGTAAQ